MYVLYNVHLFENVGKTSNQMRPFIVHNSHMMHTMVHTWRGQGCSIFVEINVNRQSNPRHSVVHSTLKHLNSYSKLFINMISKSVHHLGISAGVITVELMLYLMKSFKG